VSSVEVVVALGIVVLGSLALRGLLVSGGMKTPPCSLVYMSVCIFCVKNPVPYQESRAL
jgi:hypothetical protein